MLGSSYKLTSTGTGKGANAATTCSYGTGDTFSVVFYPGSNKTNFNAGATYAPNKPKTIKGLGNDAFSASPKLVQGTKEVTWTEVEVLEGTLIYDVLSTKATLAQDESIAKKILPLI